MLDAFVSSCLVYVVLLLLSILISSLPPCNDHHLALDLDSFDFELGLICKGTCGTRWTKILYHSTSADPATMHQR